MAGLLVSKLSQELMMAECDVAVDVIVDDPCPFSI